MGADLISRKLAAFVTGTRFSDIPAPMVDKAKRHILDTFGAGIAGALSDETAKLARVFAATGSGGECPLWATGRTAKPRDAALANGMACHTFELDDTGGCDHSGAVVIPAAMAVLPLCSTVSGEDFITAVTLGYDIARRALEACGAYEAHNGAGWHSTSTCGTFGAAAACGYLLGLDTPALQSALGLAASTSGGLWAFIHDGAQSKRLHAGRAAEGGLTAALLAREGFSGPGHIFEDVWGGFTKTYAPTTADPDAWTRELGTNWKLGRVSIKPYASCRGTHSAVDALGLLMRENGLNEDAIARIDVRLSDFLDGMCAGRDVTTLPAAQMSLPYALAARLIYGNAGLKSYAAEHRSDARIEEAFHRIVLHSDAALAPDEEPFVSVTTRDGRSLTKRIEIPLGAPANPVSDADLVAKYRDIATLVWPDNAVNDLQRMTGMLEQIEDMQEIAAVLATPPQSTAIFS